MMNLVYHNFPKFQADRSSQAIFAMPVIDWDSNGAATTKTGFKQYWAITAPLTLVVFMIWGTATILPWRSWLAKLKEMESAQGDEEMGELGSDGRRSEN